MHTLNSDKSFKILLVDDKPENLISLEEILTKPGRTFLRADSGNEALKQVLKNEDIGLIMLDVQMPEMDGFEVARILKSNSKTKDISIIFVTAISKDEQYVLKGFEEGAVDYLQKPLDINVTKAKVNVFEQLHFYQKSLKETSLDLEKINKQLEKFVFIVSHDLKSPLASIIMMLDMLQKDERIANNSDTLGNVAMLSSAAEHLSGMIASILDYSRQSHHRQTIEEVSTYELTNQIVLLLFPPKHIQIKVAPDMPVIKTNKLKLQQVFQNLISNAIKYNDKEDGLIEIGAKDTGTWHEFYVKDNGPGISAKDKERVFKLFQVTDNKSFKDSSTGIGLNLLKFLVAEQGGRVWVNSEPGLGSSFHFEWRK
ncbi:sensor histidine kinase [Chitinophagaceae bacterium LWZ2-11]